MIEEVEDLADVLVNRWVVDASEVGKGINGVCITARGLVAVARADRLDDVTWQVVGLEGVGWLGGRWVPEGGSLSRKRALIEL